MRYRASAERHFHFARNTAIVTIVVVALLALQVTEVAVWAVFYHARKCFPDFPTAAFFPLVSYSTVGYGNLSLNSERRLLGGVEALTGTLMVGWSTALLLSVVTWIYKRRRRLWQMKPSSRASESTLPAEAPK